MGSQKQFWFLFFFGGIFLHVILLEICCSDAAAQVIAGSVPAQQEAGEEKLPATKQEMHDVIFEDGWYQQAFYANTYDYREWPTVEFGKLSATLSVNATGVPGSLAILPEHSFVGSASSVTFTPLENVTLSWGKYISQSSLTDIPTPILATTSEYANVVLTDWLNFYMGVDHSPGNTATLGYVTSGLSFRFESGLVFTTYGGMSADRRQPGNIVGWTIGLPL